MFKRVDSVRRFLSWYVLGSLVVTIFLLEEIGQDHFGLIHLISSVFLNMNSIIGLAIVAVITLIAAVWGLDNMDRTRAYLWWIIPCAVISVVASPLALLLYIAAWFSVGN